MIEIIDSKLQYKGSFTFQNVPKIVMIHHALHPKCTVEDIHSWHLHNGWLGFGYHYFVTRAGKVYKGRPEKAVGSHEPAVNRSSIGICLEGCYQDYTVNGHVFTQKEVPDVQLSALILLVNDIRLRYNIPVSEVKKHSDYSYKLCPGNYFPWNNFISKLDQKTLINLNPPATTNYLEPTTLLKLGSKGESVKWLQHNLNYLGFNCGKVDGDFGNMTDKAVKDFQKKHNLIVDGLVGKQTVQKIKNLLEIKTVKEEVKKEPVQNPLLQDVYRIFIDTNKTVSANTLEDLKLLSSKMYPNQDLRLQNTRTGDIFSVSFLSSKNI